MASAFLREFAKRKDQWLLDEEDADGITFKDSTPFISNFAFAAAGGEVAGGENQFKKKGGAAVLLVGVGYSNVIY